VGTWSACS